MTKGRSLIRSVPTGDHRSHFEHVLAPGRGVPDEHHGFGGVGDHGFEFVQVGNIAVHILGRPHGHDKIDVGQGVSHPCADGNVLHPCFVVLAGKGVLGVGAGRRRAEVALAPLHLHGPSAVAVIDGPPPGDRIQAGLDNVAGDLDPFIGDNGTGGGQHFPGAGMKAFEARFFNYFKSRLANFPDLVIGQDAHVDTAGSGS
jgi:hypothetical protein